MVHLRIAQLLQEKRRSIKDVDAFYMGSLAPDAIMFRPGCLRSDKAATHFCIGGQSWGHHSNYDEWLGNLNTKISNYSNGSNPDFLLGYYAHIYADIAYTERFYAAVRDRGDQAFTDAYLEDCYEIDSRLYQTLNNQNRLWISLEKTVSHSMPGLIGTADLLNLLDAMKKLYCERERRTDHEFRVVSMSSIDAYINEMAEELSAY